MIGGFESLRSGVRLLKGMMGFVLALEVGILFVLIGR